MATHGHGGAAERVWTNEMAALLKVGEVDEPEAEEDVEEDEEEEIDSEDESDSEDEY